MYKSKEREEMNTPQPTMEERIEILKLYEKENENILKIQEPYITKALEKNKITEYSIKHNFLTHN